jgi:hypothetical protein
MITNVQPPAQVEVVFVNVITVKPAVRRMTRPMRRITVVVLTSPRRSIPPVWA